METKEQMYARAKKEAVELDVKDLQDRIHFLKLSDDKAFSVEAVARLEAELAALLENNK